MNTLDFESRLTKEIRDLADSGEKRSPCILVKMYFTVYVAYVYVLSFPPRAPL